MSSPSEPDDTVSISIERSFLPSFITEPLPNWRSIWDSAADNALLLSMEEPSTIRRAVTDIGRAPYDGDSLGGQIVSKAGRLSEKNVLYLFQVRNMFFLAGRYCPIRTVPAGRPVTGNRRGANRSP